MIGMSLKPLQRGNCSLGLHVPQVGNSCPEDARCRESCSLDKKVERFQFELFVCDVIVWVDLRNYHQGHRYLVPNTKSQFLDSSL